MSHFVLLFENGSHLLIDNIKRSDDGSIKSGFVINGAWNLQIKNNEMLCKAGNYIVNRLPLTEYKEIKVPDSVKGDYTHVISWAEKQI